MEVKRMKKIWILKLALLVSVNNPVWPQKPDPGAYTNDFLESFLSSFVLQSANNEMKLILSNLAINFKSDKGFIEILSQITYEGIAGFTGPYSIKTMSDGTVQYDLSFILSTKKFANYIASQRLLPDHDAEYNLYLDYWKDIVAERFRNNIRQTGDYGEMPSFIIYDLYFDSQLNYEMLDYYTNQINREIITWIVMHEIGHHKLGHFSLSKNIPDEQKRQNESDADKWALLTMYNLNYPVDGVLEFLEIQAYIEQKLFGDIIETGTHPSWRMRSKTLSALVLPEAKQLQWNILHVFVESKNNNSGGFFLNDCYIAYITKPSEFGMDFGFIAMDEQFQFLSIERNPPYWIKLFAYQPNGKSIVITINQTNSRFPEIAFGYNQYMNGSFFANGRSFTDNFTHYQGILLSDDISISDALGYSFDKRLRLSAKETTNDPAKQQSILAIIKEDGYQRNQSFSDFTKGKLSPSEFIGQLTSQADSFEGKMKTLLGNEGYDRWLNTLFGDNFIQFGMAKANTFSEGTSFFSRLEGNRAEVMSAESINMPVRFRNQCRSISLTEMDEIDQLCRQYDMFDFNSLTDDLNKLSPGFRNSYSLQTYEGDNVVIDGSTGLMWQRGGSFKLLEINEAYQWINELNYKNYAGFSDWRLPTIEETLTLTETEYYRNQLHINPVFDDEQLSMWTCDTDDHDTYYFGINLFLGLKLRHTADEPCYVRAVRTIR